MSTKIQDFCGGGRFANNEDNVKIALRTQKAKQSRKLNVTENFIIPALLKFKILQGTQNQQVQNGKVEHQTPINMKRNNEENKKVMGSEVISIEVNP